LQIGKGPKHFVRMIFKFQSARSYSTKSRIKSLASVKKQSIIEKGLQILAKHWLVCYSNPNKIFYDLKGILKLDSIWFTAYLKLKNNKKAKTWGFDENIVDSLTKRKILELKEAVLSNKFSWIGVRRIMVSKPGKLRPLGISSINNKLVQEILRTILEPVFELNFSYSSHGFRPNRGCHTALKWMNANMKDSIWFIEGYIKNYFPSRNYKILMKIIERKIQDSTILRLIRSGLKAKIFPKQISYTLEVGIPQGSLRRLTAVMKH
jgi:retron-type reverse transcriptase